MGKGSGTALGVIALFLSLGFGGYFLIDKFVLAPGLTTPSIPSTNQYFDEGPALYVPSGEAWSSPNYVNIEFNLTEGETVYFSYEGLVLFDDSSVPTTYIEFRFQVDGIIWNYPRRHIWRYNAVTPGGMQFSVGMQHYNSTMSAGSHTVAVIFKDDHNVDMVSSQSLFVLTFK